MIIKENNLVEKKPQLAKEWNYEKNEGLLPESFTVGSNKKVWWKCIEEHEWEAIISNRTKGTGCPYCSGQKATKEVNLLTQFPILAKEWNYEKNNGMAPQEFTSNSNKKVWWVCNKGHEWEAKIANRKNGRGCPYCSNKKVNNDNCLSTLNPLLASQWHPEKNQKLTPNDVTPGSNKKVWWLCEKGHEWQKDISSRNNGLGCPYCSNKKVNKENSLQTTHPNIAKEWHPHKNESFKPSMLTAGSDKKIWWLCDNGHEWEARVYNRKNGGGCPYCINKKISLENSLYMLRPDLAEEWHPHKNGKLSPKMLSPGSDKKVWWLCKKGHEWQREVYSRSKSGCPYCGNKKVNDENSLDSQHQRIAAEWNYERNVGLTPRDVVPGSNKRVWWKCENGHEWEAVINARTYNDSNCPYCIGARATKENNLSILFPKLASEWNHEKNIGLNPENFLPFSNQKVWWKCEKNHEWEAVIGSRTVGVGCPTCNSGSSTSFPEQAIYYYFKQIFKDAKNRYKKTINEQKVELDIYIPSLNLGIEYDGFLYHISPNNIVKDELKNKLLSDTVTLIRIREEGLPEIKHFNSICINRKNNLAISSLKECIILIGEFIMDNFSLDKNTIQSLIFLMNIDIETDRFIIIEQIITSAKKNSFPIVKPELLKEWHPDKNGDLNPYNISRAARLKAWWKCEHGHEWEAYVYNRTNPKNPTNCPYCTGRMVTIEKSLSVINPVLSKEWHYQRNGSLTPEDVLPNSGKKVWWKCSYGHEWEAQIAYRNSRGKNCPKCKKQNKNG